MIAPATAITRGEEFLAPLQFVPHIDLLLQTLRINRDRLNSRSKIAIDTRLLRALLRSIAAAMPFSAEFYLATYPDIAEAHAAGDVADLHEHFIESGYFEGRLGAAPEVDEAFYLSTYKDVAQGAQKGEIMSGAEHYLRTGASEGRIPNARLRGTIDNWMALLRDELGRG